jgi:hypothetical protein
MYPILKSLCTVGVSIRRLLLGCGLILLPRTLSTPPESIQQNDECVACVFQRRGNLPYILRRAIHESGPDENLTFGHCFVCLRCPQPGNDEPIPWCRGWWPSDPDGGDYEGDDGRIYADEEENWDSVDCVSISTSEAIRIKSYVYNYSKEHDYQVINQGARSCLGYCSDVIGQIDLPHSFPLGDLTIPGTMTLPSSRWKETSSDNHAQQLQPYTVMENMWLRWQSTTEITENPPTK